MEQKATKVPELMGTSEARRQRLESRNRSINQLTTERLKHKWMAKLQSKLQQTQNTLEILFDTNENTLPPLKLIPAMTPESLRIHENRYFFLNEFLKKGQTLLQDLQQARTNDLGFVIRRTSDLCMAIDRCLDCIEGF